VEEHVIWEQHHLCGRPRPLLLNDGYSYDNNAGSKEDNDYAEAAAKAGIEAIAAEIYAACNSPFRPRLIRIISGTFQRVGGRLINILIVVGEEKASTEAGIIPSLTSEQHSKDRHPLVNGPMKVTLLLLLTHKLLTLVISQLFSVEQYIRPGGKSHEISYKELSRFDFVLGDAITLADGNRMPLVGASLSAWPEIPMEQAVRNALLHGGIRLFDFTYFDNTEGEFGRALARYLERLQLSRTDVYIVAKFHTDPPLARSDCCSAPLSTPATLASYMSTRVEKCCRELGGYIDLALIRNTTVNEYLTMSIHDQQVEGGQRVLEACRVLLEYRGECYGRMKANSSFPTITQVEASCVRWD
jgi:hypothetical protein